MVALKASEVDAFITRPDPKRPIVLVYGPDAGLVRERVDALVRAVIEDPEDPFILARLDGDTLADEPNRLVEEAHTVSLFGGCRAVWVKAGSRNLGAAVEALIAAPPAADCRVVIEAGDLKRSAPLRIMCERTAVAAALPCYADAERDLARLVDEEMRTAGLSIAADARALLISLIGGDRRASRNEIRKLALYGHGTGRIEIDDVIAVVADASALALDGIVDAAFAGRPQDVEVQFSKAQAAGTHPNAVIGAALRHVLQLHKARLSVDDGVPTERSVGAIVPPVHFRRKALVERALATWTAARLEKIMAQLADAALETRRRPVLAAAIAERALLSIATAARRKR